MLSPRQWRNVSEQDLRLAADLVALGKQRARALRYAALASLFLFVLWILAVIGEPK